MFKSIQGDCMKVIKIDMTEFLNYETHYCKIRNEYLSPKISKGIGMLNGNIFCRLK